MFTSLILASALSFNINNDINIQKVNNNNYIIISKKNKDIQIKNSNKFEMILKSGKNIITNNDDKNNNMPKNININKNKKYYLHVETGIKNTSFKINNKSFYVKPNNKANIDY